MRRLVAMLMVGACSADKGDDDGGVTTPTPTPLTTTSTPTDAPTPVDSGTPSGTADTFPWPTRFPTADTGPESRRQLCDPGADPVELPPAVISTDPLTGCMAGRSRVELAKPLTLGSVPDPQLGPGSASCVYDTLSFPVSSDIDATVPSAVQVVSWNLTTGVRGTPVDVAMSGPDDQVLEATTPGICAPDVASVLHTRCDGVRNQGNGIGLSGFAQWTTGSGLFEVTVPWGDDIDEMWVWVLVDRHQLALGPWPATRDGDDWSLEKSWVGAGLATDGDDVQVGVIGCLAGTPVGSRVVP